MKKTEIRSQGEIFTSSHRMTSSNLYSKYPLTGQVRLAVVALSNVRIVSPDINLQHSSGNGLERRDILALLNLEEIA